MGMNPPFWWWYAIYEWLTGGFARSIPVAECPVADGVVEP